MWYRAQRFGIDQITLQRLADAGDRFFGFSLIRLNRREVCPTHPILRVAFDRVRPKCLRIAPECRLTPSNGGQSEHRPSRYGRQHPPAARGPREPTATSDKRSPHPRPARSTNRSDSNRYSGRPAHGEIAHQPEDRHQHSQKPEPADDQIRPPPPAANCQRRDRRQQDCRTHNPRHRQPRAKMG